eukprot:527998-Rhodomonas_salina.1
MHGSGIYAGGVVFGSGSAAPDTLANTGACDEGEGAATPEPMCGGEGEGEGAGAAPVPLPLVQRAG